MNRISLISAFLKLCLCFVCFFTGKAKQLEAKMVQKLQEDVDMGDDN